MKRTQSLSRRQQQLQKNCNLDIFAHDPFKIQSYNFHYAERPAYPIRNYRCLEREKQPQQQQQTPFKTYYYNPAFNDKENISVKSEASSNNFKFSEHRRRKFLHDFKGINTTNLPGAAIAKVASTTSNACVGGGGVSELFKRQQPSAAVAPQQRNNFQKLPATKTTTLLQSCCNRNDYLRTARGSSTSCLAGNSASRNNILPPRSSSTSSRCFNVSGGGAVAGAAAVAGVIGRRQTSQPRSASQPRMYIGAITYPRTPVTPATNESRTSIGRSSSMNVNRRSNSVIGNSSVKNRYSATRLTQLKAGMPDNNIKINNTGRTMPNGHNAMNAPLEAKRSTCSGCEININITALENSDDDANSCDNVRIKIETDACLQQNNNNHNSNRNNVDRRNFNIRPTPTATRFMQKVHPTAVKSMDSIFIDKHLSKFSLTKRTTDTTEATRRERLFREEIARERERFAERERAMQRERERERLRQIERERERQQFLALQQKREQDRLNELKREQEMQRIRAYREREYTKYMPTAETAAAAQPIVTMQSHLYRQQSTERLPGMIPFHNTSSPHPISPAAGELRPHSRRNSPRSIKSTSAPAVLLACQRAAASPLCYSEQYATDVSRCTRAKRTQATTQILGNLRGLKRTAADMLENNTNNWRTAAYTRRTTTTAASKGNKNQREHKLLNTPMCTNTLNNLPIRITTSSRQLPTATQDCNFNTVRIRNFSRDRAGVDESLHLTPYNVNINVYADNMKMMRV